MLAKGNKRLFGMLGMYFYDTGKFGEVFLGCFVVCLHGNLLMQTKKKQKTFIPLNRHQRCTRPQSKHRRRNDLLHPFS